MNDADWAIISGDLARHEGLFDLSGDLGESAVGIARDGVLDHFDQQVDPDGKPWPELSEKYAEYKARHWPGNPINVREGLMRSELEGDHTETRAPDSAIYTAGDSPEGRAEIGYAEEGDPWHNRPARKFVDLNAGSVSESDRLFDDHFEKGTAG